MFQNATRYITKPVRLWRKPTLVEHLITGKHEEFWALKDINLSIKKGEKVGIIGPNGSGKTTLLKIIAGITSPTSGRIETHGKIVSFFFLTRFSKLPNI